MSRPTATKKMSIEAKAFFYGPATKFVLSEDGALDFTSPGSGERYMILNGACSCPAGKKGRRCWHLRALQLKQAGAFAPVPVSLPVWEVPKVAQDARPLPGTAEYRRMVEVDFR